MTISDRTRPPMTTTSLKGPTMIQRGEVREVRELKRGVQAKVCLGASTQYGSAVVVLETASPAVMKAMAALKAALQADALALYGAIQETAP